LGALARHRAQWRSDLPTARRRIIDRELRARDEREAKEREEQEESLH
jgi:hypothetical protein